MNGTFGDAATHWASLAARWLGWRPGEFWGATPVELATALRDPAGSAADTPPSRNEIARMMERDSNG